MNKEPFFTTSELKRSNFAEYLDRASWPALYREEDVRPELLKQVTSWQTFLRRFPRLTEGSGRAHSNWLLGKPIRDWRIDFPGADHTFCWKAPGVRGGLIVTTFPYRPAWEPHREAAEQFAVQRGLTLEVDPPDVPDLWAPPHTLPIVWSRAGVDWRSIAKEAA